MQPPVVDKNRFATVIANKRQNYGYTIHIDRQRHTLCVSLALAIFSIFLCSVRSVRIVCLFPLSVSVSVSFIARSCVIIIIIISVDDDNGDDKYSTVCLAYQTNIKLYIAMDHHFFTWWYLAYSLFISLCPAAFSSFCVSFDLWFWNLFRYRR